MALTSDGPHTPHFAPVPINGNTALTELGTAGLSKDMAGAADLAPKGACVGWGLPFAIGDVALAKDAPLILPLDRLQARWVVFMHTADLAPVNRDTPVFMSALGVPLSNRVPEPIDHLADYIFIYEDGGEERVAIKRRYQIGSFGSRWGDNCFEAVPHQKPAPFRMGPNDEVPNSFWGWNLTNATSNDMVRLWLNWLWAWENPHPERPLKELRIHPKGAGVLLFGLCAGNTPSSPLRWRARRTALLTLPDGVEFDPSMTDSGATGNVLGDVIGGSPHIKLDMGQVISAQPRPHYPNDGWSRSNAYTPPEHDKRQVLVDYASHPDARFHVKGAGAISVADVMADTAPTLQLAAPAERRVTFKVVDKDSGLKNPVRLHVHGATGQYYAPMDRNRIPNPHWFQDFSVDHLHLMKLPATYINGETEIKLPLGPAYVEISKGFEIRPIRKVVQITSETDEIVIEIERELPWRAKGWVSADTHVHFLSPGSALLEGAGEDVNVINLLASQWGELFTNVGDFDGKTTFGASDTGGDGHYLVRVGTENRQPILGHISLLGYQGQLITPLCSGGPAESAIGDPVESTLTEWAKRCKEQKGTTIIPHFPHPRGEHAAAIVAGVIDGVEITPFAFDLAPGLDPYSLADWYRYLNCGYQVAAVGGTDKMTAATAVGAARTYAQLEPGEAFSYEAWQSAVHRGHTFATYGPLLDFTVDGQPPGSRIQMSAAGGTLDIAWEAASVTIPMTRIELIVNGEIRESRAVDEEAAQGSWTLPVASSSWAAILVRGRVDDGREVIAAHSSPVMMEVAGTAFFAAADAQSILQQIEGSLAYVDNVGTRAEETRYRQMRLALTAAHRQLHNRLHAAGVFHEHNAVTDHE